jgi:hypothetical protein
VILKPGAADGPMVAVAGVMLATALTAVRNVPIAAIAIAPVITGRTMATPPADAGRSHRTARLTIEILVAVVAIGFARHNGILKRGIDASDNPADAVNFMNSHQLAGNVLADYAWGQYVIWHGAPGTKVFIDSRYDLGYPPTVIRDYVALDNGTAGGSHTLAAYPHDFVLLKKDSPAAKLMESQPDWRLIYSDQVAVLYARKGADAANIPAIPVSGTSHRWQFP